MRPHLVEQRDGSVEAALQFGQGECRTEREGIVVDLHLAQLRDLVDAHHERRPASAEVDLDTPVRRAGHEDRIGTLVDQLEGRCQVGGTYVLRAVVGDSGGWRNRCGLGSALRDRIVGSGLAQRVGSIPDRPVPRAAAEVATHRVQVEAVRAVFGLVGGPGVGIGSATRAIVLSGH